MKYSNELKVGLALVLSVVVFVLGIRYFEDIPLFSGTYTLHTSFENAGGLVAGNSVRVNGVTVGQVEQVALSPDAKAALVRFHVHKGVRIPQGSTTSISGTSVLGAVRLDVAPGPSGNDALAPGAFLPSASAGGLDALLDRAPDLVDRADTLLFEAGTMLGGARGLLENPESDLRRTLTAVRGSAEALNGLLRAEQDRLTRVLDGVATLTDNLNGLTGPGGDSLRATVQNLNQVLARLDRNMASLEQTTASLDAVVGKINRGEGTLGRLVNDDALYVRLDSTLANLNRILLDFEQNPKRYLKDLKLVDVF